MLFQFGFYWVVAAIIIGSATDHRVDQSLDVIVTMVIVVCSCFIALLRGLFHEDADRSNNWIHRVNSISLFMLALWIQVSFPEPTWPIALVLLGYLLFVIIVNFEKRAARNANANNPNPENNNVAPRNLPVAHVIAVDNNVAPGNLPIAPVVAVDNNVAPGNLPVAPVVAVVGGVEMV
ncbi:hypothetical protein Q3G72_030676 [Acer saccharum]|nr:hypothetical protein Q3G72_030676 [Acer saccharum]